MKKENRMTTNKMIETQQKIKISQKPSNNPFKNNKLIIRTDIIFSQQLRRRGKTLTS